MVEQNRHSDDLKEETHGTMYILWLNIFAEQMMVCLLVFLTVWLIAKTHLVEVFPVIIKPSDDMHVPHNADEYRRLALDICTIFFFAIVFYFSLMFSVAHNTRTMTTELEGFEDGETQSAKGRDRAKSMSEAALGSVADSAEDFELVKCHFVSHMRHEMSYNE